MAKNMMTDHDFFFFASFFQSGSQSRFVANVTPLENTKTRLIKTHKIALHPISTCPPREYIQGRWGHIWDMADPAEHADCEERRGTADDERRPAGNAEKCYKA